MTHRSTSIHVLGVLAATAAAAPLAAQAAGPGACEAGTVQHIFIDNHSIFDTSDPALNPRFRWAYSLANRLHIRTKKEFINRELLFDPGDCYDPVLLEESARLLRAYDFIARADVYGVPQEDGSYHVVVDTEDEWTTQVEIQFDASGGLEFEQLEVREENILGTGQAATFFYHSMDAILAYGVGYETPQLFRTRWDLSLAAGKTRAGTLLHQEISYPFLGETGRWAMREWYSRRDRFFDYVVPPDPTLCPASGPSCRILVPVAEEGFQLAGLRRFGRLGNLTVLGGGFSVQRLIYPGDPATAITLVQDGDYDGRQPAGPELRAPAAALTQPLRNVRGVLLIGKRNITWQQRTGLDSFEGEEDVRVGAELELAIARSLPAVSSDNDMYLAADFYAAAGPPDFFVAARVRADGRRDFDAAASDGQMKDVLTEAEVLAYLQPPLPNHTLVVRGAASAGWRLEIPFQLTLGGERVLRGLPEAAFPGGQRLVIGLEDRWHFPGLLPDVANIGSSFFADVGRIWPGDAPYGIDSGWRGTLGTGLRVNFPAGGTNTFRVDVAFPVGPDAQLGGFQLLIGVGEYLGVTAPFLDPQLGRSRIPPVTGSLLHFPG